MADVLVVGSKIKEAVKKAGCNCGGDLVPALSVQVEALIEKAVTRCRANKRATVQARDL